LLRRLEALERAQEQLLEQQKREAELRKRLQELQDQLDQVRQGQILPEIIIPAEDPPAPEELARRIATVGQESGERHDRLQERLDSQPILLAGSSGFHLQSADQAYRLRIRGMVQADSHVLFGDDPLNEGNNTFSLRRARFSIEGTLFDRVDFRVNPQYGGFANGVQILDADIRYRHRPWLGIRAGKFKGPVGLEVLQPIGHMPFSERSMVSGLVPLRSIGVQLEGQLGQGAVEYAAGIFNPAGDGQNTGNANFTDHREYAGRLSVRPFHRQGPDLLRGLGLGMAGSYSQVSSNQFGLPTSFRGSLPGYFTAPAFQPFFTYNPLAGPVVADGSQWRLSPELTYHRGPFGLVAEYVASSHGVYNSATFREARLTHSGWQLTADWVLTGERAALDGIRPDKPFDPRQGTWGAWQLAFRHSQLNIDPDTFPSFANPMLSAHSASSWSVGLNWWLSRQLRVMTSFTHTAFTGGGAPFNLADPGTWTPPASVTRQDENVWATRIQLYF
jgi:phosphate-selective porin OprO/OprP